VRGRNPEGLKFGRQCAAPFKLRCAKNADLRIRLPRAFAWSVPTPLKSSPGAVSPGRSVARTEKPESIGQTTADHTSAESDDERKTVPVLFADIKVAMELIENLEPEEARA
jgi:hypothetical protein